MKQNPEKMHDSLMNNIEWQLMGYLDVDYSELSGTEAYGRLSTAVWDVAHSKSKGEESDESNLD